MTEKINVEDPKKQVKDVEDRKCNKKQTSFQATYFHILLTKKGMMTQKITKMWKYTMYQKDKSKHICTICQHIFSFASVKTRCDHYFCACCLDQYFRHKSSTTVTCPVCPKANSINYIKDHRKHFQIIHQ